MGFKETKGGSRVDAELKRRLMRLAHGEVSGIEEESLRETLAEDEEAKGFFEALNEVWKGLELPAPRDVPPGFSQTVMMRLREERSGAEFSWRLAPGWVPAATAVAALTGILVGVGAATLVLAEGSPGELWTEESEELSLVEGYVEALGEELVAPDQEGTALP